MNLLSHVRGDGDLLEAWFEHYIRIGVTCFHLVVHGPRSENAELYRLVDRYPVVVRDEYDGEFLSEEKARRINKLLQTLPQEWMFAVDSDEFVELPYRDTKQTVRALERVGATALSAPFLQRLSQDGTLATPTVITDPFWMLPLCSTTLYEVMGVQAASAKFPLFRKCGETVLEAGNHIPPNGPRSALSGIRGVTHHFKWRRPVLDRLSSRANSAHTWRHESAGLLSYLTAHDRRLPTDDAFAYSRRELFRRGLLRRAGGIDYARRAVAQLEPVLPGPILRGLHRLRRSAVPGSLPRRPR